MNRYKFEIYTTLLTYTTTMVRRNTVNLKDYKLESDAFASDYLQCFGYENIYELIEQHPMDWEYRTARMIAETEFYFGAIVANGSLMFCEEYVLNKYWN